MLVGGQLFFVGDGTEKNGTNTTESTPSTAFAFRYEVTCPPVRWCMHMWCGC